ncbi:MAG: tyrosine-type recombinase/integrase [Halolamina sp.]
MSTHRDDLQRISPADAQELFLDHKKTNCTEATVQNHRYRTNHFVRWCGLEEIDNPNDLTGRHLQQYHLWRKEDGDLCPLTVKAQMSTLRVFLKWAASIEAVPSDLYDKIMIPRVSPEERQRDETLDADTAETILEHLSKYNYDSEKHVIMALLWETSMRVGGAHSLDVDDVDLEEEYLQRVG